MDARIARFRTGNFGDSKSIGEGASESRIDLGPGYRIYYGVDGNDIILLNGGDKSSQTADISDALSYWRDHKERKARERKQT
jgi:putative addiction module killer protein